MDAGPHSWESSRFMACPLVLGLPGFPAEVVSMKARLLTALLIASSLALGGCSWLKDEFFFTLSRVPPAAHAGPGASLAGP